MCIGLFQRLPLPVLSFLHEPLNIGGTVSVSFSLTLTLIVRFDGGHMNLLLPLPDPLVGRHIVQLGA